MQLKTLAYLLGFSGLVPFISLTIVPWVALPYPEDPHKLLIAYGAIILSFMGAIHWGIAMSVKTDLSSSQLGLSVMPALLGWLAFMLPLVHGYSLLILSFIYLCIYDKYINKHGLLPDWYLPMRIILTSVVVLCLAVAATAAVMA